MPGSSSMMKQSNAAPAAGARSAAAPTKACSPGEVCPFIKES
jgi:hypothetical protein